MIPISGIFLRLGVLWLVAICAISVGSDGSVCGCVYMGGWVKPPRIQENLYRGCCCSHHLNLKNLRCSMYSRNLKLVFLFVNIDNPFELETQVSMDEISVHPKYNFISNLPNTHTHAHAHTHTHTQTDLHLRGSNRLLINSLSGRKSLGQSCL